MDSFSSVEIGALVAGLTELVKSYGLPSKYIPLVAIFFGISFSALFAYRAGADSSALVDAGLQGLLIGLVTTGLYKGGKSFIRVAGVPENSSSTPPSPVSPPPSGELDHG